MHAMQFEIVELGETDSTNRVAAERGRPGQVFCAEHQTAGRGRLNHRWLAPPGANLLMSVVLPVGGWTPEEVSTLPLVVGYAVLCAVREIVGVAAASSGSRVSLKWPNDVLVGGRKVSGILCERRGDAVIAGIGVNVCEQEFPSEIAQTATCLAAHGGASLRVADVRGAVLAHLAECFELVRASGFAALHPSLAAVDHLRGRTLAVLQTDADDNPIRGICDGIAPDGSLLVGGRSVYAGEAHVLNL